MLPLLFPSSPVLAAELDGTPWRNNLELVALLKSTLTLLAFVAIQCLYES